MNVPKTRAKLVQSLAHITSTLFLGCSSNCVRFESRQVELLPIWCYDCTLVRFIWDDSWQMWSNRECMWGQIACFKSLPSIRGQSQSGASNRNPHVSRSSDVTQSKVKVVPTAHNQWPITRHPDACPVAAIAMLHMLQNRWYFITELAPSTDQLWLETWMHHWRVHSNLRRLLRSILQIPIIVLPSLLLRIC